jgi:hypothetical protein
MDAAVILSTWKRKLPKLYFTGNKEDNRLTGGGKVVKEEK